MMKKLIAALGVLPFACFALPANAQPPAYQWTGCYVGGHIGGAWGDQHIDDSGINPSFHPRSFLGGAQVGCDYQSPTNWVFGLQGDVSWLNANNSAAGSIGLFSESVGEKIDWFASTTARLGYAAGPWLIYGKGGAAWVREKFTNDGSLFIVRSFTADGKTTLSGWTLGGGLEFAFAPNWSANVEYDFYDFGTRSTTLSGVATGVGGGPFSETISVKQNFSVVKVGLSYHFGTGQ